MTENRTPPNRTPTDLASSQESREARDCSGVGEDGCPSWYFATFTPGSSLEKKNRVLKCDHRTRLPTDVRSWLDPTKEQAKILVTCPDDMLAPRIDNIAKLRRCYHRGYSFPGAIDPQSLYPYPVDPAPRIKK
eukprot:gene9080-biopygen2792